MPGIMPGIMPGLMPDLMLVLTPGGLMAKPAGATAYPTGFRGQTQAKPQEFTAEAKNHGNSRPIHGTGWGPRPWLLYVCRGGRQTEITFKNV